MAGSTRNTYGVTGNDPSGFVEQEATSSLDSLGKGLLSAEWTDEKHSLYLKSMEASFVDQLYNSMDLLCRHRKKEHHSTMRSSKHINSHMSDQFKVHKHGRWQQLNFGRAEPLPEETDGHHLILANPWIKHFRAGGKPDIPLTVSQENIASGSQPVYRGGKMEFAHMSANISMQFAVSSHHQDCLNSNEEVSDQNFADEEGTDEVYRTKRLRTSESAAPSNDQVVPFSKSCMQDMN
ncbi:hypothetical protein Ancab_016341 [Ancistrocladus abbreviatus]